MDSDSFNQKNNEDAATGETVKKSLLKSVSTTALKIGSVGILSLILVGGGILYLNRVALSQAVIKNITNSKGVSSDVKIDQLGLGGAKFTTLTLGEKGKETLVAHNGFLKWHYSWGTQKLIIDDFSAKDVTINLGLDKNGIDLRDFKKFTGGPTSKSQGSPVAIDAINADNINVNLATPYGIITNHGFAKGDRNSGFIISIKSLLPEKIDAKHSPIGIGITTSKMTGNRFTIGAALKTNGNDFTADEIIKGLSLKGLNTNLSANITTNGKFENVRIELKPSQIFAEKFVSQNMVINGALANIDATNINGGNNLFKDAVIDANGKFNFASANLAGNGFGASNLGFAFKREKNGKSKLEASLVAGGIRSKFGNGNVIIKSLSDFDLADLQKFNPDNLSSQIAVNGNGINGGAIEKILNQTRSTGFNIGNNLGLNSKLLLSKKGDKIAIYLDDALEVHDNRGTRLVFKDGDNAAHISAYNFEKRGDEWSGELIAKGQVNLITKAGNAVAELKGLNISSENIGVEFGKTSLHNLQIADLILNGAVDGAKYISAPKQNTQGNISGRIVAQSSKYGLSPSLINFSGQIVGKRISLKANAKIKSLDTGGLRLANSDVVLNATSGNGGALVGNFLAKSAQMVLNREYALSGVNANMPFNASFGKNGIKLSSNNLSLTAASLNSNSIKSKALSINGAMVADIAGGRMAFNSPKCLGINLQDFTANDYYLPNAKGRLCPDNAGRLALINDGQTYLYARTAIDGAVIRMGSGADAQTIGFTGVDGAFSGGKNGEILYNGNVRNLDLRIKTGENQFGNFNAENAKIALKVKGGNTTISGTLSQISAQNMPMTIDGSADATINISQKDGMNGKFAFKDLRVKDAEKEKRFGDLILSGSGNLKNNHLFLQGVINHEASANQIATFYVNHELASGEGSADINATALQFYPYNNTDKKPKFGIEDLVPILRGTLVDTSGIINGDARFEWGRGKALKSNANINTDGLDFNTVPAQFYGVAGNLVFDDLLSLKTAPHQEIRIKELNPGGLPIENGVLTFSLDGDNSINVINAQWPFADGILRLDPTKIDFNQGEKNLTVSAENIDIAKLLLLTKVPNIEVEGRMSGTLPVRMIDNDVEIVSGKLSADEGGILRYIGPDVSGKQPVKETNVEKLKEKFTGKPAPQGADLAIQALRNLHYKVLAMEINGRITGDMNFQILLEGNNPDLLSGKGFLFRIGLDAPVGSLRSFYQRAFEFDTNALKRNEDGTYQYLPNVGKDDAPK